MSAQILSGKELSGEIRAELKQKVAALKEQGKTPGLVVIQVGEDPASTVYVNNKEKACIELGIHSQIIRLPQETTQDELLAQIDRLNADQQFHGILVQLPLPKHIDEQEVIARISPKKDVDGFHVQSAGALLTGTKGFVPCTPKAVMKLLDKSGIDLTGKNAVVIGRSNIVGKPVSVLLLSRHATVTICHSRTKDLAKIASNADVLVAAIGKAEFVTGEFIKEGAVVIDVGINRGADGKLKGDVKFDEAAQKASYITPVPGGVGPMTITMLMDNTIEACELFG